MANDPICDLCCRPKSRPIHRDLQCPETTYFLAIEDVSRPSNPDAVKLAEAWLRECSSWLLANDLDMVCPMEADPLDIADDLAALSRQPYPAPDVERVAQRFSERASDTLHGMFDWDGVSDAQWEELTIKLYDVAADELTALTGDGIQDKSDA